MTKDKMGAYLTRNITASSLVAIVSMVSSIMDYYHCDLAQGLQRVFIYNIMTLLYLLILCSLNYCVFEFLKIITDHNETLKSFKGMIIFTGIAFMIKLLPIHSLFQYNFFYLSLLVVVRIAKQLYKKRSLK